MKKYRKKPIVIEAIQFNEDNISEATRFCSTLFMRTTEPLTYFIPTLEGDHQVKEGDFIIKGIAGEFYPCKPDIFLRTYEEVTE